jgi:GTP-binding protein
VTEDFEILEEDEEDKRIKIAIVGRPNAGKSSIVNALLNTDRVIVSDVSGTTRDSIDSFINYKDNDFVIVDTAGIRKKSKVDYGVEKFAVDRAIRSIRDCDVAVLVIDAKEGISDQDKKISSIITESGKGLIVAINKWDLIEEKQSNTINKFEKQLAIDIPFLSFAPKIFISAVTKQRLGQIFEKALEVYAQCTKRISTGLLNKVINEAYALNPPTSFKGKRLKIYYMTQARVQPPTFVLFVNNEELLKDSYKRYLENKLREAFGFFGTPIRISVRERGGKN